MSCPVSRFMAEASRSATPLVSTAAPTANSPTVPGRFTSTRRAVRSHSSSWLTAIKISAALLALLPAAARAQTSVRAITSVATGASDNARGVPGDQKHTSSFIGRTSAGLDLGYQGATSLHLMRAAVGAIGYPGSDSGTSFTEEAELASQFTWQRLTLELGATGSHSELNDLSPLLETNLSSAPQPAAVVPAFSDRVGPDEELVPLGTIGYVGGSLAEAIGLEISPLWSLYQNAGLDLFSTTEGTHFDPPVWAVSNDMGLERAFPRDAARLEATIGHEHAPLTLTDEGVVPEENGDYGRAALGWSHQYTAKWRSDLTVGAYAARAAASQPFQFGPAWRASLAWKGRWFKTQFLYDRSTQPSVVMGGIFLTDRISARATGRFGRDERFRFTGLIRYSRLSAIGIPTPLLPPPPPSGLTDPTPPEPPKGIPPDQQHDHANRWQAQVTVGFVPWINRLVELNLSYRLTTQTGATLGRRRMKTFERNVVMLTLVVGFPTRPDFAPLVEPP
jgi:hypothetical protein